MTALAHVLVHHARWVLAATLAITLSAAAMMPRLAFNADVTSFLLEGSDAGRDLAALQEKYATADPVTVLLERDDGGAFTDRDGLVALARVRDALRAVPGVASVGTALPDHVPIVGVATTPDLLASLPTFALGPLLGGPGADLLLANDGRLAMAIVLADGDPVDLAGPLRAADLPAGIGATFAGSPVVYAEVLDLLGWFLLAIPPLVLGLLLTVFAVTLGSVRHAALALLPALLGSLWTFGLIFGLGLRVDVLTVIVPVFVIVMGSADGLHLVSHLQQAAARGVDRVERVAAALREVGVPMVLTTVSTAVGFLALVATDLRPVRQLGTFVAVGIVLAGLISLLALPALLSRVGIEAPRRRAAGDPVTGSLVWLAERRWTAYALAVPLLVFVALFLPRLEVDPDQLFFFKDGHPVREGYARIEAAFGGRPRCSASSPSTGRSRSSPSWPRCAPARASSRPYRASTASCRSPTSSRRSRPRRGRRSSTATSCRPWVAW
jgi:uncharacterized protein